MLMLGLLSRVGIHGTVRHVERGRWRACHVLAHAYATQVTITTEARRIARDAQPSHGRTHALARRA